MIPYIIYDLTYMWSLKKKGGEGMSYRYRKQNVDCQTQGLWGWAKRVKVVKEKKIPVVR